ncbi:hypothetical protein K491DRAFT_105696 [Lophiostoma macrostomum CBS 122681]|uniref:Uncharacterized protein n=1 Tax=Lophiostoma macrostomum CBS 122681 TaxID=1314788 RepID=A0A6A6TJS3_9PLEO|nr:hypothetical protein K491DRAFT_105696 [Lophiostoma macrostomum CBS 122681]
MLFACALVFRVPTAIIGSGRCSTIPLRLPSIPRSSSVMSISPFSPTLGSPPMWTGPFCGILPLDELPSPAFLPGMVVFGAWTNFVLLSASFVVIFLMGSAEFVSS